MGLSCQRSSGTILRELGVSISSESQRSQNPLTAWDYLANLSGLLLHHNHFLYHYEVEDAEALPPANASKSSANGGIATVCPPLRIEAAAAQPVATLMRPASG